MERNWNKTITISNKISRPFQNHVLGVDFWSEIGPQSTKVDFLVDPFDLDRISHYLAYYGVDVEVIINDLQQEIDNEDSTKEVRRPKRQNTFFDLLSVFSAQSRPRRKPQVTDFTSDSTQQPRFPRKFPSSNSNLNKLTSPSQSSSTSNFDQNNSSSPGNYSSTNLSSQFPSSLL